MLPQLTAAFIAHLIAQQRLSILSIKSYARDVHALCSLVEKKQVITVATIRSALVTLHAHGLSPRSLSRMLSCWRQLFRYLMVHHGWVENPSLGIRAPKIKKRLPTIFSVDRIHEFFRMLYAQLTQLKEQCDPTKKNVLLFLQRDIAILELLYSCGLRVSELVNLNCQPFYALAHVERSAVRVVGKNNKERIVPLGIHATRAITAWLSVRVDIATAGEEALFVNQRGTRLSQRTTQKQLHQLGVAMNLDGSLHPHLLRHTFASHMLESSGDLRAVQDMLGHTSLASTQIYTHLNFQTLAKVYDATHPRAHIQTSLPKEK